MHLSNNNNKKITTVLCSAKLQSSYDGLNVTDDESEKSTLNFGSVYIHLRVCFTLFHVIFSHVRYLFHHPYNCRLQRMPRKRLLLTRQHSLKLITFPTDKEEYLLISTKKNSSHPFCHSSAGMINYIPCITLFWKYDLCL